MREVTKTIGLTITAIDIQKGVDDGTGFVYLDAVGADETPDIDGEIFDYISSKPYVKAWSAEAETTTKSAGQSVSYGNIRCQHGGQGSGNVAGTVFEPIEFRDDSKGIHLKVKVVDKDACMKVAEGAYRGMSVKGRLVGKKWKDGNYYRYTVDPIEWSLVDKPANPNATISVVKADGLTETLEPIAESKVEFSPEHVTILKGIIAQEFKELIAMTETTKSAQETEVEKAAKKGSFEKAKKAHEKLGEHIEEMGEHLEGKCKCAGMAKCAEKMASCHEKMKAAHESMGEHMDTDGSKETDGEGEKAASKADVSKSATVEKSATDKAVEALTAQVAELTVLVNKAAEGKGLARPVPMVNGAVVHTREDGAEKDVIEKRGDVKADDPNRVDKIYNIDRAAEPELVKI